MKPLRERLLLLLPAALICVFGCGRSGDGKVDVSGTVTFNGKPIEEGTIQFVHTETTADTVTVTGGRYATRIPTGSKKIVVHAYRKTGELLRDPTDKQSGYPVVSNYIPSKFNEQSELTTDVTPAGGVHNFDLIGDDLIDKAKK